MTFVYNTPIFNNLNIPPIAFKSTSSGYVTQTSPIKDSFSTNPIYDKFGDKNFITQCAKSSPEIMRILRENKIPLKVNIEELEKLKQGHLKDTRIITAKMYSALPAELKTEVNLTDLQQAAMLHDYGKVLIPEKVLNKSGKLNDEEKKIMELHSELGVELLKKQGVNENILRLVKYHHQTPQGKGYPRADDEFKFDISAQILVAADKYSALREKRSYKDAMNKDEALEVIKKDFETGLISREVYEALKKAEG